MIKYLKDEFGYKNSDLKNKQGNNLTNPELEEIIKEEKAKLSSVKEENKNTKKELVEDKAELEVKVKEDELTGDPFMGIDETSFAPRHNLKDNDLILCMSGVSGDLTFESPMSGFRATTSSFGQTMKIPYKDLVYVNNIARTAFEEGQMIILNKDLQEEFGLREIYKNVITPNNIPTVLQMKKDDLSEFIDNMPEGMKATLYDEARKLYRDGKIDSIHTVDTLEEKFGVSFKDNAPIKDMV